MDEENNTPEQPANELISGGGGSLGLDPGRPSWSTHPRIYTPPRAWQELIYREGEPPPFTTITTDEVNTNPQGNPRITTLGIIDEITKTPPILFTCKGYECENTNTQEAYEGGICNSCWLKTHDNEDAECICIRCDQKQGTNKPSKNQYIIADPESIMHYTDWETKGYKYTNDMAQERETSAFMCKSNNGDKKITIFKIVRTPGNRSTFKNEKTNQMVRSSNYYLCIAIASEPWNAPRSFTYETLDEALQGLELLAKQL